MLPFLHRRATRRVLREFGFSPSAQNTIGYASTLPDLYRWYAHPPHAETSWEQRETPQRAAQDCAALFRQYIANINAAPATTAGIIWFGCALHLVQDLAAHEGRTVNEHAVQILLFWKNPDYQPRAYRTALEYSRQLLAYLVHRVPAEQWRLLKENTQPLARHDCVTVLGNPDFSAASLLSFARDGLRYLFDHSPHKRVRWDAQTILRVLQED